MNPGSQRYYPKIRFEIMLSKLFGHLAQMKTTVFFSILFFYLLCLSFQGLDFNDEGFHVAFYQQIFSDPGSVQYGFWMWLTGIFGGLFLKIFPFLGLWGIRLEGTICLLATIGIAYRLLAKYLNPGNLRLSIFILVLFINEFPRTFYYNNFSGLCYLIGAFFLYRGLKENKTLSILLSGLVVCLNIFNRTPNLLGLGIWIAIPYYEYLTQKSFKSLVRKTVYFFAGILSGLLFVFITMKILGHLDIFINSMKMVFGLSREIKSNDGLEGAYQISKLLIINIQEYAGSIRAVFLVLLLILLTATVNKFAKTANRLVAYTCYVFNFIVVLSIVVSIFLGFGNHYRLVLLITGISLLSTIMLFDRKCDAELRLLIFLGAFILLVHPFGSSEGITTVIAYSVWLSFPVSIDMLMKTESASLNLSITKPGGGYSLGLVQNSQDLLRIKMAGILLITFACLFNVIKYPNYFDRHDRLKMTYTVNNQWVRGLFTTQPKAEAINDLLRASTKYMKPGDIVLAYDCMPLYHFMTETKSYVRNPCIWYYTSGLFKNELDKAQSNSQLLPVVVRQKINTIGSGSGWPEILPPGDYLQIPRNQKKNQYFNEFLSRYSYTKVWSSPYFEILIPRTN